MFLVCGFDEFVDESGGEDVLNAESSHGGGGSQADEKVREQALAAYLNDEGEEPWGLDITMEVIVDGHTVSRPPVSTLYWTAPQMIAHMTVNGAPLRPGDFFGSGTVSGPEKSQRGSFLELSWGGKEPFALTADTEMSFLTDGQIVTLRGTAPGPGGSIIDFSECTATVLPST